MATLNVYCAGAAMAVMKQIAAKFESDTGHAIAAKFGAVGAMKAPVVAGEPADVVVLTAALIDELIAHVTQRQFVYAHAWKPFDLVVWDNRCTMHRGRPYEESIYRRDMRRATIQDLDPGVQDRRVA